MKINRATELTYRSLLFWFYSFADYTTDVITLDDVTSVRLLNFTSKRAKYGTKGILYSSKFYTLTLENFTILFNNCSLISRNVTNVFFSFGELYAYNVTV